MWAASASIAQLRRVLFARAWGEVDAASRSLINARAKLVNFAGTIRLGSISGERDEIEGATLTAPHTCQKIRFFFSLFLMRWGERWRAPMER